MVVLAGCSLVCSPERGQVRAEGLRDIALGSAASRGWVVEASFVTLPFVVGLVSVEFALVAGSAISSLFSSSPSSERIGDNSSGIASFMTFSHFLIESGVRFGVSGPLSVTERDE